MKSAILFASIVLAACVLVYSFPAMADGEMDCNHWADVYCDGDPYCEYCDGSWMNYCEECCYEKNLPPIPTQICLDQCGWCLEEQ